MVRMAATDVRNNFSEILNKVSYGGDRIVIHRNDKDQAVLVPLADVELLEMIEDRVDLMLVEEAMKNFDPADTIPLEDFLAEFEDE